MPRNAFIALAMTAPDHEQPEPTSYGQAMKTKESHKWQEASEVPKEKRPITGRWVFKRKVRKPDNITSTRQDWLPKVSNSKKVLTSQVLILQDTTRPRCKA